jgi:uncharacterized protein (DUF885 family)
VSSGRARLLLSAAIGAGLLTASPAAANSDAKFRKIAETEYHWRKLQEGPDEDSGSAAGASLPDVGPKTQAEKLARWSRVEEQLRKIRPADLSPAERTNYLVYKAQIDALLAAQRFREFEKPLNSDTSFWGEIAGLARGDFRNERDYRNYIAELKQVPRYFDQQIENMRAGLKRGFTPPRVTLQGRDAGVAEIANATDPEKTVFFEPFKTFPVGMPAATQAQLRGEAEVAIRAAVIPAHAKLLKFLRDEYIPGARTTIAAYDLPDGKAYYRSKIREFVTLDLPPEQIHQTGLAEVARIRARMLDVMKQVGFKGDLPAFLNFLRTDPQFYAKTPQDLLNRAAWIAKTFDGKASQWFGRLPRSRFAIKPVPTEVAPFYTGGRGGPGIYLVNTYNLPARPLYSLPALTLHESAPGHAFQMPLAGENKALPDYRRDTYISAYGEGWALYCEALGEEMGMYQTPYETFGMLSYQMWRASRLVVDTGIHSQGWTRERAQKFLHDNTALADHEIETEVDRYIAWPGQALSYYMGELEIQKARRKAEQALGPKFNIRAFHDALLELGSVPLPVIDQRVDRLIAEHGKGPYPNDEK